MWMIYVFICIWTLTRPIGAQIPPVCEDGYTDFPSSPPIFNRNLVSNDADHDGRTFLAVAKATINCTGRVTEWHVEFNIGRCDYVSLQIWRPTGNAANMYVLVGQNYYRYASPCNQTVQNIKIPTQEQIPVRPNDVVGWRQDGRQGMLLYDESPQSGSATFGRLLSAGPGACTTATTGDECLFNDTYARDYRIQANVEIDDQPRLNHLNPNTSHWSFFIREDTPPGALVYKVRASPRTTFTPTLGHTVYYRLDTYKPKNCDQLFEIGETTGEIRTKVAIDRLYLDSDANCTFTLRTGIDSRVMDTENATSSVQTVSIHVLLLNLAHAFNTSAVPSIIQLNTVGSLDKKLLSLILNDPDYLSPLGPLTKKTFFISGARPDAAIFILTDNLAPVPDNTGELRCHRDLTFITEDEPRTYELNIMSSDGIHSAGPLSVRVEITNLRVRPVLTVPPFSAVIPESETGVPYKSLVNVTCKCDNESTYSLRIVQQYPRDESVKFNLSSGTYMNPIAI